MDTENVGFLLHKLTKYQTLHSNSRSNEKRSLYQQKIGQYMNKLEACGADKETLNQMGGLIGGADGDSSVGALKDLIEIQKRRITAKMTELGTKTPGTPSADETALIKQITGIVGEVGSDGAVKTPGKIKDFLDGVNDVKTAVQKTKEAYKFTIDELVGLIRQLLKSLIELENDLLGLEIGPGGLASVNELRNLITELENKLVKPTAPAMTSQEEIKQIIVNTYFESLFKDIAEDKSRTNKIFYLKNAATKSYTNQLSVEMRQLARLMGYTVEGGQIKLGATDVADNDFIKDLFGKFVGDTTTTSFVSKKINGNELETDSLTALKDLSKVFAAKFKEEAGTYDITKTTKPTRPVGP